MVASQVRCILKNIATLSVPSNRALEFQNHPAGTPPVKVGSFDFFGTNIHLIPTVGIFITMVDAFCAFQLCHNLSLVLYRIPVTLEEVSFLKILNRNLGRALWFSLISYLSLRIC